MLMGPPAILNGGAISGTISPPAILSPRSKALWRAAQPYVIIFVAAFLSALSGFMMGSAIGIHSQLDIPDARELGEQNAEAWTG